MRDCTATVNKRKNAIGPTRHILVSLGFGTSLPVRCVHFFGHTETIVKVFYDVMIHAILPELHGF
jgi:hypothetical protein